MYKIKSDGYVLNLNTGEYFNENSPLWEEYQDWIIHGNTPEPEYSKAELAEKLAVEIKLEKEKRIDQIMGDARDKNKRIRFIVETQSRLAGGEIIDQKDIDVMDSEIGKIRAVGQIEAAAESAVAWVKDESRTAMELESYSVTSW